MVKNRVKAYFLDQYLLHCMSFPCLMFQSTLIIKVLTYWSGTAWFSLSFDRFCQGECVWALASTASVLSLVLCSSKQSISIESLDFIWEKNWLLSAYCQIFLSTEQILVELWWHVYQNKVNVDQNKSYLAEVRVLNLNIKISMQNSSNTTRNINKHG